MNILKIDTSSNSEVIVGLKIGDKEFIKKKPLDYRKAQAVLPMVESILKQHKIELKNLDGIEVKKGPGSFTGLRVGVAVANALGYLLDIPVNEKKIIIEPSYK